MPLFDFLTDDDGNILTTDVSDSIRSFITAILAVLNDSAFDDEFILMVIGNKIIQPTYLHLFRLAEHYYRIIHVIY